MNQRPFWILWLARFYFRSFKRPVLSGVRDRSDTADRYGVARNEPGAEFYGSAVRSQRAQLGEGSAARNRASHVEIRSAPPSYAAPKSVHQHHRNLLMINLVTL